MKKLFLLIPALVLAVMVNAAIPDLTKSAPLTLTAASEGFSQSDNAKPLEDGEWINWPGGTIHEGFAKWNVNIVDPGVYSVTLDMKSDNTYKFRACVINPATGDTIAVGRSAKVDHGSGYANATEDCGKFDLFAREAGEYIIAVTDTIKWSEGKVRGMTLTYLNGATINMPETLDPVDALLSEAAFVNGDGELRFTDDDHTGNILEQYGMWSVYSKGGVYSFTLNANSTNSHHYKLSVLNPDLSLVQDYVLDGSSNTPLTATTANIELAKGNYIIKIQNTTQYSTGRVINIIANYNGGSLIDIPETLMPEDALLSTRAWVDKTGAVDSILFTPRGSEGHNPDEWAKWKINVSKAGKYKFTANVSSSNGQYYKISVLNSDETETVGEKDGTGSSLGAGDKTFATDPIELAAGNYVVKIANTCAYSEGRVLNIVASYEGGAMINVPDTLWPVEAIKSEYAFVNEDGELRFTDDSHTGYVPSQWGKWNIHLRKGGLYNFTLEAFSSNSHHYYLSVLNTNESEIEKYTLDGSSGQVLNATTANLELAAGDYIIKIENFTQYSYGRVRKIIANYEGGAVIAIPDQLLGEDALLYKSGSKYMIRTEEGYLKSSNNGSPTTEWAVWNITASAGTMNVTLNLDPVTSSGHNYRVELYQGAELKDYTQELESAEGSAAVHSKGNIALEKTLVIPTDGTYTIKLVNRTQWSSMILQGITFEEVVAPAAVVLDEMDEDNSAWIGYKDGDPVNVTLNRTLKAGMYNTFCLPFAVSSTQCKAVFGNDVEIYTLGSAVVEGTVLNVTLDPSDDIYQGTPVFIKPSADVVNPSFEGVSIVKETPASTTKTNANLVGTFVKTTLTGGENILYLGPSNTLYYPEIDTPIKGMRAWFAIHDAPTPAPAIKRMNIVNAPAVVTEINLIDADNKAVKTIENGQLIITIDGVRYNVMGTKIQ